MGRKTTQKTSTEKEMREIKFRAWCRDGDWDDNEEKREFVMIGGDSLSTSPTYMLLKDSLKDIEDEIYFMQYTGLKDKNGKEIYEGDIIKMQKNRNNIDPIFQDMTVEWNGYGWGLRSIRTKDFDGKQEKLGIPIRSPFFDMGEIIGNIYENPELLTHSTAE